MCEKLVCYCSQVTEDKIMEAIKDGDCTLEALRTSTGACTLNNCKEMSPTGKCCSGEILALIKKHAKQKD